MRMAQLRHPHIVHVADVDRDENSLFFVMEYVDGKSLSQHLRERRPLPLPEVLRIGQQIAHALEYAHNAQPPVIHRDIKPANILLETLSGRVVVTDFGLAKILGATEQTQAGTIMGTVRYCAPEQLRAQPDIDGRVDIYALGLILYEMAAGRPFFTEWDQSALFARVAYSPEENLPTFAGPVPPEFVALVTKAIARNPEQRYARAVDLLADLKGCQARLSDEDSTYVSPQPSESHTPSPPQPTRVPSGGGATAFSSPGSSTLHRKEATAITLTIVRHGNTNIIDFAEVGSLIPRSQTQVDSALLRDLSLEVVRLTTPGQSRRDSAPQSDEVSVTATSATVRDLQRIGELLFSHLLTEPARKRLRAAPPSHLSLRLDEQLIQVPWELCFDGEYFLTTKFRIGRQVITDRQLRDQPPEQRRQRPGHVLLIADPTETLPEARREIERLGEMLQQVAGLKITVLGGKDLRKVDLLAELQMYDAVHFAGHSYYDTDNPQQSGWRLHGGVLTAGELSKLSRPPLLVFSNSCQAGATAQWESPQPYEGHAFGIGSAFLLAGVPNFIGTFWAVNDEESLIFASAFYRQVVQGTSLGQALLFAKRTLIQQKGAEGLTWASYMLYGDPAFTLLPEGRGKDPSVTITPIPAPTPEREPMPLPLTEVVQPERSPARPEMQAPHPRRSGLPRRWLVASIVAVIVLIPLAFLWKSPRPAAIPERVLQEYRMAFREFHAGHSEEAVPIFQRLIADADNTSGLGYAELASYYAERGFPEKADELLRQAFAANPNNAMALLTQGDIVFSKGERTAALHSYEQAVAALEPGDWQKAWAHNALGVYYALVGREADAQQSLMTALSLDARHCDALGNLGYLAWRRGNVQEAQRHFDKMQTSQCEEEIPRAFLDMIVATTASPVRKGTGEKILIVPFVPRGGTLRRLGEGDVLAWKLLRALPATTRPEILSRSLLPEKGQEDFLSNRVALLDIAKDQGASLLVTGRSMSFPTVLLTHGQVTKLLDATEHPLEQVQEGGDGRLTQTARSLADQVGAVLTSVTTPGVTPPSPPRAPGKAGVQAPKPDKRSRLLPPREAQRPPGDSGDRKPTPVPPPAEQPNWERWIDSLKNRGEKSTGQGAPGNRGSRSGGSSQRLEFGR
jgi:serine/threonine protein kinase/tetratricopeptide (TPR) repeat protein